MDKSRQQFEDELKKEGKEINTFYGGAKYRKNKHDCKIRIGERV